jgi:glycerophosphoryl diester phosphodiesterase
MRKFIKTLMCAVATLSTVATYAQEQEIRVFSHRGGRKEFDENTMAAFQASYDAGYRGFEVDIRYTKDGEMVITHDHTLERTTNGVGIVEEKTAEELRALVTKKGGKLAFLPELLDWLKDKEGLYVEFEMKTKPETLYPEERLYAYCDQLYAMVMKDKPADAEYVFTSSDYRGLRYLQQKYPGVDLLMITSKPLNEWTIRMAKGLGITRIGATMSGTTRDAVKKAHKEGLTVSLWPGHTTKDFVLGAYLGADFMCTDIPIEVKKFAEEKTPWLKVRY